MKALEIREWDFDRWTSAESEWTALLESSGQDALFLSWRWMRLWWKVFGNRPDKKLCLLAAYQDGRLTGIAPLYQLRVGRRLLPVRSIQFIGIYWRNEKALISEYLDVISPAPCRAAVRAAFVEYLRARSSWSELIVSYTGSAEAWAAAFHAGAAATNTYARTVEHSTSHQADLSRGFTAYLAGLGQSTRRSLFNLRRRLDSRTPHRFEHVTSTAIAATFEQMNSIHRTRWGHAAFEGARLRFHLELARELAATDELRLSTLSMDGNVVSVLYDIRRGARQYNIKLAFDPRAERGFSLGLIHLGYALEHAARDGVTTYDFLAGRGLKADYKSHLSQQSDQLATVQLLRGSVLPRLYRWYDARGAAPVSGATRT